MPKVFRPAQSSHARSGRSQSSWGASKVNEVVYRRRNGQPVLVLRGLGAGGFLPVWVGGGLILYDTSAWVALAVPGDRRGPEAKRLQAQVSRGAYGSIVTTSFVLDEVATFVRMETDTESAVRLLRSILASAAITTVWIDPGHFGSALDLFQSHQDKRWSLTDCTSFVVMRDLGTEKAFSFDRNFEEAGFVRVPCPARERP